MVRGQIKLGLGSAIFCNNMLVALLSRDSQIGVAIVGHRRDDVLCHPGDF